MTTAQTEPLVSAPQAYCEKMFNLLGERNSERALRQFSAGAAVQDF